MQAVLAMQKATLVLYTANDPVSIHDPASVVELAANTQGNWNRTDFYVRKYVNSISFIAVNNS